MTRKVAWRVVILVVAVFALAAAALLLLNAYRDSIALGVARSALSGSGVTVTDVSVDSISSSEVLFDGIVLELADGATVFIEGVTLPLTFGGLRDSTLHIDSVRFQPGMEESGPPDLAAALQSYLDAPEAIPGATIEIDDVLLPGMPVVHNFAWHADPLNPTLRASITDFEIFVTTTRLPEGRHKGSIRALLTDDTEALMAGLVLTPDETGIQVDGTISVVLGPFVPLLRTLGAVPAGISSLAAAARGTFDFRLDADATVPVTIKAVFDTVSGTAISYLAGESAVDLAVVESAPLSATLGYPSLEWTARMAGTSLSINAAGFELPPVRLSNSECHSGLRCRTALELSYAGLAAGGLTIDTVAVSAANVAFASHDDRWEVSAPDTQVSLRRPAIGGRPVIAPGIRADVTGSNDRVSATARFTTPDGGLAGTAELSHDLLADRGELVLESAILEFGTLKLSDVFHDWPYGGDIEAGRAFAEAGVRWKKAGAAFAYEGEAVVTADTLAGHYDDIGFVGFSSRLNIGLSSETPVSLKPARFDVALIDVGFPVENVSGTVTPSVDDSAIAVSALSMDMLGGTVTAEPFRYHLDAESNEVMLHASGVQLPLMAGLADLKAVTISGSVSGDIPVTIRGKNVIIDDGFLENDPPGGVIRYGGSATTGIVDDGSQLGIVTRTLRNFEFDSLTSAVSYSQDGDLVLRMRLKGINPDVDPTQPVILNLNVENNVPQMLRSLQATRSIEDVLEQRLSK